MDVIPTSLPEIKLLRPARLNDERGFFSETFKPSALEDAGIAFLPIQDNHVLSRQPGTVRGLHWQAAPLAQAKLVRVLKGAIFDVVVDIRPDSATFGRHVAMELNADNWLQLFIPAGFAHGYCTLTADTEVFYKVDSPWSKPHERGVLWNDPALTISWPVDAEQAVLNSRDAALPLLHALHAP
ncbi:MAG: dTDP-4-dehydrorhamnose 3,5-epimerase [Magnetospirillum sp.]|nr:dTDP-4-dehydrorhamnose 3,5-epimerase [Magnetospirillum sp.]